MKQWIKYYTETIDDPKFCSLTWAQRGLFDALILLAGQLDHRDANDNETGRLDTVENISFRIRCELSSLQCAVDRFNELKMTHIKKGILYLTNYQKRQARPPSDKKDAARMRQQRHREAMSRRDTLVTSSLPIERHEGVTPLEEKRVEEIRLDLKALSGASAPAAAPVEKSKSDFKPTIAASAAGASLQLRLNQVYESMGRKAPTQYRNPQMQAAYETVIPALGAEFEPLTDKAFERGITDLANLLAWYQSCLKRQTDGSKRKGGNTNGTHPDPRVHPESSTRAAYDKSKPKLKMAF